MTQHWRPDTCGCVVEQLYDYSGTEPVLTSQRIVSACADHINSGAADVYEENVSKNMALWVLAKLHPERTVHEHEWKFAGDRTLWLRPHRDVPKAALRDFVAELERAMAAVLPEERAAALARRVRLA